MKNLYYIISLLFVLAVFSQGQAQQWVEIGDTIIGEAADDECGNSIDISADGRIIAVGAWQNDGNGDNAGHVRIFENIDGTWTQVGNDIEGETGEKKGFAVSLNDAGDIVAVSTPYFDSNTGKVSIYKNIDGTWTKLGNDIPGKGQYYYSGVSIDLSANGNQIAISNHAQVGYIRIYKYDNETWTMTAEITGTLYNEQLGGGGLKFNEDATIIAAKPTSGTYHPFVRVFKNSGEDNWVQIGDSIPDATSAFSISRDGTTVASGNRGYYAGWVKVFENISDKWIQKGDSMALPMPAVGYSLFTQLSSDGTRLVVSQPGAGAGQVLTYYYTNETWIKSDFELWGENKYDNFGTKISMSRNDSIIAVSAPQNDDNGENSGNVRIFKYVPPSPIFDTISLTICDDEFPYQFGTQNLTEEGSYTEKFETSSGIDSTVTLNLQAYPSYNDTLTLTVSDEEIPYQFGSQSLNTSGMYTETFASTTGCDSMVTLNFTVHITGNESLKNEKYRISVYPNPTSGLINIEVTNQYSSEIHVSVYDMSMRLLVSQKYSDCELIRLDLSGLAKGQYIVTIKTGTDVINRKITLN